MKKWADARLFRYTNTRQLGQLDRLIDRETNKNWAVGVVINNDLFLRKVKGSTLNRTTVALRASPTW